MAISDKQQELLEDIIENTEAYESITVKLDLPSRTMTIEYYDLDDEWFKEMLALMPEYQGRGQGGESKSEDV